MIKITLNGKPKEIELGLTLGSLLVKLALEPAAVVIEHNKKIIKRENWSVIQINSGDIIEIINFVGGG